MNSFINTLAAAAAIGGISAPLAAQAPYQYGYPQQRRPIRSRPIPVTPVSTARATTRAIRQNPVGQIIDQLLGNRYNVSDRQAVSQCANAAMIQAQSQYGGYNQGYGQGYGQQYGQDYNGRGYNRNAGMRVTSITDVQRRTTACASPAR